MLEKEGKLFFCTSNQKEVYKEIKLNPYVEFSTTNQNNVWIRISGRIKFSNDLEVKTTIIEHNPLVKSIYKTPDNPIFEIFYLDDAKAVIADFSGQSPKQYNL